MVLAAGVLAWAFMLSSLILHRPSNSSNNSIINSNNINSNSNNNMNHHPTANPATATSGANTQPNAPRTRTAMDDSTSRASSNGRSRRGSAVTASALFLEPNALSIRLGRLISACVLLSGCLLFLVAVLVEFAAAEGSMVKLLGIPLVRSRESLSCRSTLLDRVKPLEDARDRGAARDALESRLMGPLSFRLVKIPRPFNPLIYQRVDLLS